MCVQENKRDMESEPIVHTCDEAHCDKGLIPEKLLTECAEDPAIRAVWCDLETRLVGANASRSEIPFALLLLADLAAHYEGKQGLEVKGDPRVFRTCRTPETRGVLAAAWAALCAEQPWAPGGRAFKHARTCLTHALAMHFPELVRVVNPASRQRKVVYRAKKPGDRESTYHRCLPLRVRLLAETHDDYRFFETILLDLDTYIGDGKGKATRTTLRQTAAWLDRLFFGHREEADDAEVRPWFDAAAPTDVEARRAFLAALSSQDWLARLDIITRDASIGRAQLRRRLRAMGIMYKALSTASGSEDAFTVGRTKDDAFGLVEKRVLVKRPRAPSSSSSLGDGKRKQRRIG